MKPFSSITQSVLTAGLLASCGAGGGDGGTANSSTTLAPLSQRLNQEQGYVRDSEGNWLPRSDRRSQYEQRTASGVNQRKDFNTRRFGANQYQTAEWTRRQSAPPQAYTGETDGSGFQITAAAQDQTARQSGSRARIPDQYQTDNFGAGDSRENNARRHDRPSDDQTENRRDKFTPPEIIDWRQQRDMSVDQSRSMLSR